MSQLSPTGSARCRKVVLSTKRNYIGWVCKNVVKNKGFIQLKTNTTAVSIISLTFSKQSNLNKRKLDRK